MNCQKCGQDVFMPFSCPYCGGQFCDQHRLPENHSCPQIGLTRTQKQTIVIEGLTPESNSYEFSAGYGQLRRANSRVYFSPQEIRHLVIGALLVMGVGFSYGFGGPWDNAVVIVFSALASLLTLSFFTHEIAHKVTAQKKGLWAEFRLTTWGAIMTLLTLFLPIKLISPGAVMISGPARPEEIGKISMAGPVTNIILSTVFLSATFVPTSYAWIFGVGAFLNAYIAVFNLIPFGVFDGLKIYTWNRKVWVAVFVSGIALAIASYFVYPL